MKNRIITGTGRSNQIKISIPALTPYNTFLNAARSGNLYCDIIPTDDAEGVSQVGTPLTASNLLTDATAQALGVTSDDPTVQEAFAAIVAKFAEQSDYVVQSGTSSNWSYRKWNSGRCEAWRNPFTGNLTITSQVGSLYQSASNATLAIPSGIFTTAQTAQVSLRTASYAVWTSIFGLTATQISYRALSASSRASASYTISAHVVGLWK